MLRDWEHERGAHIATRTTEDRLLDLMRWAIHAEPDDLIFPASS